MEESEFRRKEIKGINIREEKRQLFKDTKEGIVYRYCKAWYFGGKE